MEDLLLLDTIERYLTGQMLPEEKEYFKQLRKNNPQIDQMVVEHKLFLHQMEEFSDNTALKHTLAAVHNSMVLKGDIYEGGEQSIKGRVVQFYHKYKKVTAIAASIAGVTALGISMLVAALSPNINKQDYERLVKDINNVKSGLKSTNNHLHQLDIKMPKGAVATSSGTAFLIDGKGYLITNAHVLGNATNATVTNGKGQEFTTKILSVDQDKDLAILKIEDEDFKTVSVLPYAIKKSSAELGEEIFTLGYPRYPTEDIVYNMGYLSSASGYNGDTASCSINLSANPGNSGGPVFNRNGDVVGILTARQNEVQGVVFAVKAKKIFEMVDELKKEDTAVQKIKIAGYSTLKGQPRVEQNKKLVDYVFIVKAYSSK
jgi:serine protease Do